jgi:hypothetical protein
MELGKGVLTSRIRINVRKGVLTSRIRIKWWNWEREYLPSGSRSSGGTGKGSAYPQNPDQVVELGKEFLPPGSGLIGGTGYNGSAHFQDSD